jgi:hypothetical protein
MGGCCLGFFLVIEQEVRWVGLVRKVMKYGHQVFDMLNSSLMVIISSHQNYVDSESGEKQKEAMWIHHFVILQLFHPKYQKVQNINFVHDNHSLFVRHFYHDEDQEYTNLYEDTPRFE